MTVRCAGNSTGQGFSPYLTAIDSRKSSEKPLKFGEINNQEIARDCFTVLTDFAQSLRDRNQLEKIFCIFFETNTLVKAWIPKAKLSVCIWARYVRNPVRFPLLSVAHPEGVVRLCCYVDDFEHAIGNCDSRTEKCRRTVPLWHQLMQDEPFAIRLHRRAGSPLLNYQIIIATQDIPGRIRHPKAVKRWWTSRHMPCELHDFIKNYMQRRTSACRVLRWLIYGSPMACQNVRFQ
jgi:hypothetical protein